MALSKVANKQEVQVGVKELTMIQAINDGLKTMLEEDPKILLLGEDIGKNGGVFRATDGLQDVFGEKRVIDTPLSEAGFVGTAVGMALNGLKPVVEIQFLGFVYPAFEQIATHVTRMRTRTLGYYSMPMVIRAPYGAGVRSPEIHSDSVEALFVHLPGIKVVCPSTPYDAKGLLLASIADPDPVLFLEPMRLYRGKRQEVPAHDYRIELGKGEIVLQGEDVTIFAWGAMMPIAMEAAELMKEQGISCEVIDLRTLYPLDKAIIADSVQKTGRVVIIHEGHETGGVGSEIVSVIMETSFLYLRAPIEKVTGFDVPVPLFALEHTYLPTTERVSQAIQKVYSF
ncbi:MULTISPECIES: alpha-ketoacid dehydrogenase subunit beta [unclassified Virgibacillus]|uniref:alpha-ketoacid dehydrogenase subunit beta n=1 Tax=unclassified Virgibacillus TaxID=2620237 RepID=UPI00090C056A|nr:MULTISPECIES: alpha-ketoacid dehydrogenase subunit beta [unclassified Virgibacillus]API92651.1 alpha-ketoacid dehydrogenase subunit beta [Virgibacillus sp. 6R]MBS7428144.1 alpha-ketoacid dehydrogenase subunit beta [Virgibacillus sp. 19R1-5]